MSMVYFPMFIYTVYNLSVLQFGEYEVFHLLD